MKKQIKNEERCDFFSKNEQYFFLFYKMVVATGRFRLFR